MLTRHNANNLTWIEMQNPTQEDVEKVKEEFLLPFDVYTDISSPTLRPGAKIYDKCMYVVQHFPNISLQKEKDRKYELDFIFGENWIISVSYTDISELINMPIIFEDCTSASYHSTNIGRFYIQIIKDIYKKCDNKIDQIDSSLDNIEKNIYSGKEGDMVGVLSQKMRSLIDFEHSFAMHENVIIDVANYGKKTYGENFVRGMNNLHSTYNEIVGRIRFLKDAFKEFQNTNDSLLQHKTADAMKTLTMMSFVIFQLSLVAGIFGMNTEHMPIIGSDYDFATIILIMFITSVALFGYFKWKKWL